MIRCRPLRCVHAALLLALLLLSANASAVEEILGFHSDITVNRDGTMTVRETIAVKAEGRKIKRGIYRDFPTTYKDRLGNRYQVSFDVIRVERNGQREDYHTKAQSNGIRVYFGHKNRFLSHGEHEYVLTYRTSRQLGYFKDHDELYWNVTGNGWDFVIQTASASVQLPTSVDPSTIRIEGYTGSYGSSGQDYQAAVENGRAEFITTRSLGPRQGLTIVTLWPKGHVTEPTAAEEVAYVLKDNRHLAIMLGGLALVFIYYLFVWSRVGRDQPEGVIVPLYFPPKGYSPASMRFVRNRGYDDKAFAAALVNLAVKGAISIDETGDTFTIRRIADAPDVEKAAGENALLKKLLGSRKKIDLEKSSHATISAAIDAHKKSLKRDYERIYFVKNSGWIVPGALLSIVVYLIGLFNGPTDTAGPLTFMTFWLSIWSAVVYFLIVNLVKAIRRGGIGGIVHALIMAGGFGFFEIMGIWMFSQFASLSVVVMLLAIVGVNVVFYHLLHADTRAGRTLLDKVEGFREYLEVAESEELKFKGAPTKTTDLFEMYLPYALALDVEQQWGERFSSIFEKLKRDGTEYQPGWYHGHHWHHHNIGTFTSAMGSSLGSAISSSSTAPGSSSGGGGGGFSGGGGGGGGGGGW
ncbi:MAG: hypothetical protein AMJ68_02055 [Acidithiobacillales bacterium SG8_45]|nr:MAG: hypothetical protein AMJ68_02055 [Acidithiobacillales bacterium SG8_45]